MNDKSEKSVSTEDTETAFLMILNAQKAYQATLNKQQTSNYHKHGLSKNIKKIDELLSKKVFKICDQ